MPVLIGCLVVPVIGVAVVVIGIIAAVAIPNLVAARERTRDAAAKAELMSVMTAEEMYATENGTYTTSLAELEFLDDQKVTTTVILSADGLDYEVCSRHVDSTNAWRSGSSTVEAIELATGGC